MNVAIRVCRYGSALRPDQLPVDLRCFLVLPVPQQRLGPEFTALAGAQRRGDRPRTDPLYPVLLAAKPHRQCLYDCGGQPIVRRVKAVGPLQEVQSESEPGAVGRLRAQFVTQREQRMGVLLINLRSFAKATSF